MKFAFRLRLTRLFCERRTLIRIENHHVFVKSRRLHRIQAVGSYGFLNYGDDLFVDTILKRAEDIWPSSKVRTFVPLNWVLYAQKSLAGQTLRIGAAVTGLAWANTVAMCGGSILQDVKGIDKLRQPFLSFRRFEALGVSLGPFKDNAARTRVAGLANKLDRLIVRDRSSLDHWNQLGIQGVSPILGGDLVALNPSILPVINKGKAVSICPSAAANVSEGRLTTQVLEALDKFKEVKGHRPTVKLLALGCTPSAHDMPICRRLEEELGSRGYDVVVKSLEKDGLEELTHDLVTSSMVLTQRLHGAVVAYLSETPFLIVGHHAKCIDFADDIGLAKQALVKNSDDWWPSIEPILTAPRLVKMLPSEYRARAEEVYCKSNDAQI